MSNINEQAIELKKLWSGFQASRVLLTANNYRVFDRLKEQKAAKSFARAAGTDVRASEILLDALTGLGLLKKNNGKYRNTQIASRLLVSDSPYYHGDIIKHIDSLWNNWSRLDSVLKKGKPIRKSRNHNAFILGMHNISVLKADNIINAIGLKGVKRALDLGGGPGTYSIEMAKKGINVVLFDVPETINIAKRVINKAAAGSGGLSRENAKNIDFLKGDFMYDGIGNDYDLIFISQIVHSYSEKESISILKKCKSALRDKGRIVIQEFFIKDNRTHPVQSSLFSINMLVNTRGGRCYSPAEIKKWLIKTGFKSVRTKLTADSVLISSHI